jgi:hypothetical protein
MDLRNETRPEQSVHGWVEEEDPLPLVTSTYGNTLTNCQVHDTKERMLCHFTYKMTKVYRFIHAETAITLS